jgi:acetate kinase
MVLLLDPAPPLLRWCAVRDGKLSEGICEFGRHWHSAIEDHIRDWEEVETVGYVLHHGGEEIKSPVSRLVPAALKSLERCSRFLPEYNEVTLHTAEYWTVKLPNIRHVLLCDTAYFVGLPPEASDYGVPGELRSDGIRRYGGYGLCHQWAWEQVAMLCDNKARKLISLYLGDCSNGAAIVNGRAVDTTIGFTPVEGMISSGGCGDIDPTIVFQLHSIGMSLREITRMLSRESGFTGLLGRECRYADIIRGWEEPEVLAVREVLCYDIRKSIGAFLSVLGDVDAIVFLAEKPTESMRLIMEICSSLGFLGAQCRPAPEKQGSAWSLVHSGSKVRACCLAYNKWKIVAELIDNFILKEK